MKTNNLTKAQMTKYQNKMEECELSSIELKGIEFIEGLYHKSPALTLTVLDERIMDYIIYKQLLEHGEDACLALMKDVMDKVKDVDYDYEEYDGIFGFQVEDLQEVFNHYLDNRDRTSYVEMTMMANSFSMEADFPMLMHAFVIAAECLEAE